MAGFHSYIFSLKPQWKNNTILLIQKKNKNVARKNKKDLRFCNQYKK